MSQSVLWVLLAIVSFVSGAGTMAAVVLWRPPNSEYRDIVAAQLSDERAPAPGRASPARRVLEFEDTMDAIGSGYDAGVLAERGRHARPPDPAGQGTFRNDDSEGWVSGAGPEPARDTSWTADPEAWEQSHPYPNQTMPAGGSY